jgi:hypothetical protein
MLLILRLAYLDSKQNISLTLNFFIMKSISSTSVPRQGSSIREHSKNYFSNLCKSYLIIGKTLLMNFLFLFAQGSYSFNEVSRALSSNLKDSLHLTNYSIDNELCHSHLLSSTNSLRINYPRLLEPSSNLSLQSVTFYHSLSKVKPIEGLLLVSKLTRPPTLTPICYIF